MSKSDDTISRQAALDALRTCYDTETVTMSNGDEYINYEDAVGEIEQLPPAQPETHEKRTETHACDYVSRQAAVEAVRELYIQSPKISNDIVYDMAIDQAHDALVNLPSAQPEIVRCKDCRFYQDNNGGYPHMNCKWDANETPDADDFCSGAERKTDG